ncbi:MAG TPA: RnfABCDGE type electron transport complex subunit D [Chitinivibrionales bacterium]|jgi:electron transport complex protein RnfD|nr:RnfABCDGE type electron transport complex subunit D [Chitinivibrionales bacterium]
MNGPVGGSSQPLLHVSAPPHIRQNESVPTIMLSVVIALVPAFAASIVFFGVRALALVLVCVTATVGTEAALCRLFRRPLSTGDLSAVVTGLLLAFMLPPGLPYWMAAAGGVFAIAVVKTAFGGLGGNLVNPAAAARAFLMVSFPAAMTAFTPPVNGTLFGLSRALDGVTSATPLVYFKNAMATGNFHPLDLQDAIGSMVLGNTGGCLGATSGLAIFIGAIFLLYRGIIRFRTPISFIGSMFVLSWIFNGTGDIFSTEAFIIPLYQVLGGGVMLGAFFLAADPVTSPMTPVGRVLFGTGCGIITFVIRKFGGYPDGVCWAILLMNFCVPLLDRHLRPRRFGERKQRE